MIALSLLALATPLAQRPDCPTAPLTVADREAPPLARPLNREPPARPMLAVDARRDGCPVLLVLDERDADGRPLEVSPPALPRVHRIVPR